MGNETVSWVATLASVLGLSVVSGVNLYAAVLTVGVGQRMGWITGLPPEMHVLANPLVLVVAGVFYLLEFVADKIPFVTPLWDAIHTFIRPLGAALLAFGAAGNLDPSVQAIAAIMGGSIAFGTHSTKAGLRIAAHTVPEPTTHSLISLAEDFGVVGLLVLAYQYPWVALVVIALILVTAVLLIAFVIRAIRAFLRNLGNRFRSSDAPA